MNVRLDFLPKIVAILSLLPPFAIGASNAAAQNAAEAKHWKFAVVSIRRDTAGGPPHVGVPTADGYQMKNLFLAYLVMMAYAPQTSS